MKKTVGILLILFSVFSLGYLTGRETAPKPEGPVSPQEATLQQDRLDVFYFHVTKRCDACNTIERYTRETLEEKFKPELDAGRIRFVAINYDLPENKHYVDDYGFSFNTIFLSKVVGGKEVDFWNLTEIWNLYKIREEFVSYVESEVRNFIEAAAPGDETEGEVQP